MSDALTPFERGTLAAARSRAEHPSAEAILADGELVAAAEDDDRCPICGSRLVDNGGTFDGTCEDCGWDPDADDEGTPL